jgi:hypothetical protein
VFVSFREELVEAVEDQTCHHALWVVAINGVARVIADDEVAHAVRAPSPRLKLALLKILMLRRND